MCCRWEDDEADLAHVQALREDGLVACHSKGREDVAHWESMVVMGDGSVGWSNFLCANFVFYDGVCGGRQNVRTQTGAFLPAIYFFAVRRLVAHVVGWVRHKDTVEGYCVG